MRRRRTTSTSRPTYPATRTSRSTRITPTSKRRATSPGGIPRDPLRPITVYYRSSGTINPAQYQVVKQALEQIGFDVTGVGFPGGDIYTAMGHRGEPFDLGVSVGWCEDYHDPWDIHAAVRRHAIQDDNNLNYSYFNDPVFNERMHAARRLVGDERYDAFRQIEHDLVRDAAPWAAMRTYNNRDLFSRRIGCQLYNAPQFGGVNFANLCVRPEITTDDSLVYEPDGVVHVPVRLSAARWTTRSRSTTRPPTGPRTRGTTTSRRPGR